MLLIIIDWLYVLLTTFCMGYALSQLVYKLFSYRFRHIDSILVAGLVCATVYAQFFSLFCRVSLLANLILLFFSAVIILVFRREIRADIREAWGRSGKLYRILIPVLFLVWAYCNSRGYMVPDTQLYHSQSIRWIEEYGIVKGQGILNARFSYNSSMFALSALYSLKFVFGQSLHAMSGWIAFLLSITAMDIIKGRKKFRWSDFANVAAIYYLTTICDEVLSPSSDYASMCIVFFLVIKWVRLLEEPQESQKTAPYALLCVLGVYALTLKLTAGLILLLLIKPAFRLIRDKDWKGIVFYLITGFLVALPWMIRSVWISGWLLYPFPALDLFHVDWKQNIERVRVDAMSIKRWGRGINTLAMDNPRPWEWLGIWFASVPSMTERLLVAADAVAVVCAAVMTIATLVKKRWENLDRLLVILTVACSYLYWQLSAPLPRYGYAYVLLLIALVYGRMILRLGRDRVLRMALGVYGVYKLYTVAAYMLSCSWYPSYIRQVDYYNAEEVYTIEVDGVEFYGSEEEGIGYEYFPGASAIGEFELRGDTIEDGFRWVNAD